MLRYALPLAILLVLSACLQPKASPATPKLDRVRTVVIGERLDVAGELADELSHRGYAARPIAAKEAERADLRPRIDALHAVLRALPARRTNGAGLGSAPLALASELRADMIVHTRRTKTAKLEVAIVDGRTGALLWRQSREALDAPGASVAALAPILPYPPTTRAASTTVATTAKDT